MFLCVLLPRLCFLEQKKKKNLTRLDDWGLCAHQRCALGKTVTAGAKVGMGAKSWWQWIEKKNENPSSGKSKHCFGFVHILQCSWHQLCDNYVHHTNGAKTAPPVVCWTRRLYRLHSRRIVPGACYKKVDGGKKKRCFSHYWRNCNIWNLLWENFT